MGTVKNVSLGAIDLAGRLVHPGRIVEEIDVTAPGVAMHLDTGALIPIDVRAPTDPGRQKPGSLAAAHKRRATTDTQETAS